MRVRLMVLSGALAGLAALFRLIAMADRSEFLWMDLAWLSALGAIVAAAGTLILGQRTLLRRQEAIATQVGTLRDALNQSNTELVDAVTERVESSNAAAGWSLDARLLQFLEQRSTDETPPS